MNITALPRKPRVPMPARHIRISGAGATEELDPGTHLVTARRRYAHHGIYAGGGRVVHYAGLCHSLRPLPVQEVSLEEFARGQTLGYLPFRPTRFAGTVAVARARSRLGEDAYDLLSNNCEHFCTWCLDGKARSEQVEQFLALPSRLLERALTRIGTAPVDLTQGSVLY